MKCLHAAELLLASSRWLINPEAFRTLPEEEQSALHAAHRLLDEPSAYRSLTSQEGQMLAQIAVQLYDNGLSIQPKGPENDFDILPYLMLANLADMVPSSLDGLHAQLLTRNLKHGSNSIFREADPETRDQMIQLLQTGQPSVYHPFDLLCGLAWIGDRTVQEQLYQWQHHPSYEAWRQRVTATPADFARAAGWELTPEGSRRNLYFQANYDLVPQVEGMAGVRVDLASLQEERCGWCGNQLISCFDCCLSDLPALSEKLLNQRGERLRLALCPSCYYTYSSINDHVFMDIDLHGKAQWSSLNGSCPSRLKSFELGDMEYMDVQVQQCILGSQRRTPFDATGTHIGGCPDWPQEWDYPLCPQCQRSMMFFGQWDNVPIPYFEGYFYAFLCLDCGLSTIGQQH